VNSPTPGPSCLKSALRILWMIPLAALGFLLGANPHRAAADGLPIPTVPTITLPPVPTITIPSETVTVPTTPLLPTTTLGTGAQFSVPASRSRHACKSATRAAMSCAAPRLRSEACRPAGSSPSYRGAARQTGVSPLPSDCGPEHPAPEHFLSS
jgi:hypothetical protein